MSGETTQGTIDVEPFLAKHHQVATDERLHLTVAYR